MPKLRRGTFVVIYFVHILTTILIPIGLFELGVVDRFETLSLIFLLAGAWTLIGLIFMVPQETRQLRQFYLFVGILLVAIAAVIYVTLR